MEVKRYYFAGHAFPEPISGGGKQDGYVAWADHAALAALAGRMAAGLIEAAMSLETIDEQAEKDEYLKTITQIRGYAHSRANAARALLAEWDQHATAAQDGAEGNGKR
jgi:hypothetical protein